MTTRREGMGVVQNAGKHAAGGKRGKSHTSLPRLILLSQPIGQANFHLRSVWSECVGCRMSFINQLELNKQVIAFGSHPKPR